MILAALQKASHQSQSFPDLTTSEKILNNESNNTTSKPMKLPVASRSFRANNMCKLFYYLRFPHYFRFPSMESNIDARSNPYIVDLSNSANGINRDVYLNQRLNRFKNRASLRRSGNSNIPIRNHIYQTRYHGEIILLTCMLGLKLTRSFLNCNSIQMQLVSVLLSHSKTIS